MVEGLYKKIYMKISLRGKGKDARYLNSGTREGSASISRAAGGGRLSSLVGSGAI